jgi:acyl carrier protein
METSEILQQVNEIFIDVLDNSDIKLETISTANDVEDWDSLTHIQLVVAIEKHFNLRFTAAEIREWKNVGEMCNTIIQRLKK